MQKPSTHRVPPINKQIEGEPETSHEINHAGRPQEQRAVRVSEERDRCDQRSDDESPQGEYRRSKITEEKKRKSPPWQGVGKKVIQIPVNEHGGEQSPILVLRKDLVGFRGKRPWISSRKAGNGKKRGGADRRDTSTSGTGFPG